MTQMIVVLLTALFLFRASTASAQPCEAATVGLQVLGSGGPQVNHDRASTSYLIWLAGQARILVDTGGGAFLRFGQAGGQTANLSLIAVSHLHPDHVSDLPALLWRSDQVRKESLLIIGPSGNDEAPSFDTFLRRLFGRSIGAFPVLGGSLRGAGEGVPLDVSVIDVAKTEPSTVLDRKGLRITALGVPHGNIPSVAYRIEAAGTSIVLASDQNGTNPKFVEFARNADFLVMHLAIATGVTSPFHASPAVIGRIARDAAARRLVLSHIGQFDLTAAVSELTKWYTGAFAVADDLQCFFVQ